MFRFLHAADIHLDSPMIGLDRYESAPVDAIRGATRRAFENLVRVAIDEEVAFVLLAGDLYDGDWKDYRTGLFFVDQMAQLHDVGIPVYIVGGNHDAASQLTKNLRPPDNVHVFSTRKPDTRRVEAVDVAIHGQGFASRAVSENLAEEFPFADPGLFHVGLLHTSLDGREGHVTYAPTSAKTLVQKGYQYWALGHIHKREVVSKDPWIVFPGNLQGRNARETGPKGCTLVQVEDGAVTGVEERHVDILRWSKCLVDIEGAITTNDLLDRVARSLISVADSSEGRAVVARVEVTGPAECHNEIAANPDRWVQEIRALATSVSTADIWIEKVRLATHRPLDLTAVASRDDALGSLLRELAVAAGSKDDIEAVQQALTDLRGVLPLELLSGDDAILSGPEFLAHLIQEARDLLFARIACEGAVQ